MILACYTHHWIKDGFKPTQNTHTAAKHIMSYSSQTVSQLRELLKSRGLSTTGVKAELVSRLETFDSEQQAAGPTAEPTTEPTTAEEPATATTAENNGGVEALPANETVAEGTTTAGAEPSGSVDDANNQESEETKEEEKEPAVKILSPEERKTAALELLNKKLFRAKKFGSEEDVQNVKRDIARIEKFGVEAGTSLAQELGLASKQGLDPENNERRAKFNRHRNRHRNRGRR